MDPAESIYSILNSTFTQDLDLNLGLDDDVFNNEFNLLQSEDALISDILNDDMFLNSFDLTNSCEFDQYQSFSTKNYAPRNKSKIIFNQVKGSPQTLHKSLSILNPTNKNARVTISNINSPKVYITPATKKSTGAGTSILVKSKKAKRRSMLLNQEQPVKFADIKDCGPVCESNISLLHLQDHNYCIKLKGDTYPKKEGPSYNTSNVNNEVKNELEDMLQGFIPDDVVLNELPNCLSDLMNLDTNFMLNSEDVLHGLNDACNLMTDHYFEDLEQQLFDFGNGLSLPNLDITEDDLNIATQSSNSSVVDDCAAKNIEVDIVYSPINDSLADSFDCVSVTTGCTEESFSEDTDCHSRLIKSKRHRSLSGSSINSRRKRRFSSRSSLNSSDSMSDDTSSLDESSPSSRSSSPERSLKLLGFGSFSSKNLLYQKNHSKYHLVNKNRPRKHVSWSGKFANKYKKSALVKKKKMKVIDLTHRNYNMTSHKGLSRIETGASHQATSGGEVNEKVLYIGDIPNGTKKSDISAWFGKYGTIEDIQTYFCDTGNNYAFVTYKYSHETRNAIKNGNDDLRHSKFTLSFGKRRNNSYKDLDLFTESSLDFRIDSDTDVLDFDALLRSTTVESHKLKKYV